MDDDSSCPCRRRNRRTRACLAILGVCLALVIAECLFSEPSIAATDVPEVLPWTDYLPVPVLAAAVVLLAFSAFFSSSETAFLAIHKPRLRTMRTSPHYTLRLVTKMMDRPGRFLTTILVGNMIVNILIGVLLGARVMNLLENRFELSPALAYATAVLLCTAILVFFGEITPKVFAVRAREAYARLAVLPLVAADHALSPIRNGLLAVTDAIFRVSRFHELRAAPFITDDELKSLFDNGEPSAVIEEEERQMIRRILEFHDVTVREILIPRPDVVAIGDDASAREALELFREEGFSRIPVYDGDLDHITGLLFAKDLLPTCSEGKLDQPIIQFVRPPHFVPETTSVQQFVRNAQRLRTHLAVVVDEFGGTEGIVTLQDALEEVVGDIKDDGKEEAPPYARVADGVYRVAGNLPLDELNQLIGLKVEDEEHETVAGFLMNQTDKVPETGDTIEHSGARFTVEEVDGKRAEAVRIEIHERRGREET